MKLFVGLGNPGEKYRGNRHNIGFMALDAIAERQGFAPWRKKFQALVSEGTIGAERVVLLKPETFMNDSGRAVGEATRFLKIDISDVYVFHDELDLTPGKVKIKAGGGNAGHNGLRSLSAHLDNDYVRVRLGIGHPGSKDVVVPYVLNDFAKSERQWLGALLEAVAEAAPYLVKGDAARFLSEVARRTQAENEADADQATQEARQKREKPAAEPVRSRGSHPLGERAGKRQSALAENLKKWLSRRKSGGSEE